MIKKKVYLSITSCLFLLVTAITVTYAWYVTIQKDAFESPDITGYSTAAYFAGGDGTENNPYKLTNSRHVYNLAWLQYLGTFNDTVRETDDATTEEDETKYLQTVYFKVENDIDCSTTTGNLILPPIGTSKYPFIGNFDGGGHTISNVTVTNTFSEIKTKPTSVSELKDCSVVGLFGIIGNYEGMELPDGISVLSRVVINENGSKTIKPINAVNNLYLNNTKVKASSSEALIGIFAGYVNATIYNIGVHYADISLSTGVSKLSTSNAISNYAIIGDYNDEKTGVQWEERPGGSTGYGTSTNIKDLYDKHAANGIDTDVAYPFTQGAGNIGYYVGPGITFAAMNRTTKETDAGVTTAGIDTSSLYTHGSQSSVFTVDYNESLKNVYDGTINSPTSATGYDTYFLKVNNSYDSNNKIRNLSGYVGDTYYDGNLNLPKGGVWIAAQQTGLFQFVLVTADIDGNNQSDGGSFALYQIDRNTPGDYSTDFSATQIAMSNNSMAYATGSQIYIDNVAYNTYHETGFAFYFEYEATAGDEFFVTKKDGTAAYFWYMDIGAAGGGDEIVPIGTISKVDYVKAAGNVLEKITDQTYVRSDVLFAIDSQSTGSNVVYYFRRNSFVDSDEYPDVVLWFKEYSGDDNTNTTMSVVGDSKKQTEAGDNTCTYIKGTQSAADIVSSTISAYNTLNSAPAEYSDAYYNKIMALSNYSNSFANMNDESLLVGTEWENSDLATQKAVINTLINDALNNYYQAGANNIIALIDAIPTGEITSSNYKEYTDEIMAAYNAIDGE